VRVRHIPIISTVSLYTFCDCPHCAAHDKASAKISYFRCNPQRKFPALAALDLQRCSIQHNIVHIATSPKILLFLHINTMDMTARRSRRSRRRSASPISPTRVKRDRQYYLRMIEESGAEEERRSRLTLEERIVEDRREIQHRLE